MDYEGFVAQGSMLGSGGVIVIDEKQSMVRVIARLARFFAHESCGQCTPCRSGTAKVEELIATDRWNTALLAELSQVMRDASICGLGQAAPNPVDCVINYFPQELQP
jgi:formate dehydrogenase